MRVERRVVLIEVVRVAAGRVRLPDLEQRVGERASAFIEHAASHDYALAQRLTTVKTCEIGIASADQLGAETRPRDLGERMFDSNRRMPRHPLVRARIGAVVVWRIDSVCDTPVAQDRTHL